MSARLLFRDSQGRDGEVLLSQTAPTYVGRSLDCAIRTDDAMVSRKHSMIRMESGNFIVEDLGSSNGTHVNDVRVTKHPLAHNDVVRCGSLWLRYVEDAPVGTGADQPASPARKAGTARIDVPAAAAGGASAGAQPNGEFGYAGTLGSDQPALGYQAKPQPVQPAQPATPYGGPPAMPGAASGQLSEGSPAAAQVPGAPRDSVVVDMGGDPEMLAKARSDLASVQEQFESLQGKYDREVADGKRLRAETTTLRDRIEELRRIAAEKDDVVEAHDRVAEELRGELRSVKEELLAQKGEMGELADGVAAKERQLGRVGDDISKLKDELEDRDRQLAELSRTKDEGWKKLNEQLSEIEHFREVITEQERMLEERRVGLVSQEEVIKELRDYKEQMLVDVSKAKAERDELAADQGRHLAKIEAIDEENRRLSRLLADAQSGGENVGSVEHSARLSMELKELRVEVKTLESDNARLEGIHRSAEAEVDRLQARVAKLEVELREAREEREKALSARGVVEEALAKAEVARHKAEEESLAAAQSKQSSTSSSDDLRYELDRAKRTIAELEAARAGAENQDVLNAEIAALRVKLDAAQSRAGELEANLAAAAEELSAKQQAATNADVLTDPESTAVGVIAAPPALMDKAVEVHDSINDVLSEIRNNLLLVQGEFEQISGGGTPESVRIIADTLDTLVGNAEDAKGVLRGLRELVEFS